MAHENDDNLWPFVFGLMAGMTGGALAGLLLTSKSGDEFRRDIQQAVATWPDTLSTEWRDPDGNTRQFIDRTRYNIENRVERVKRDREAGRTAKAKRAEELASGYDYGN